MGIPTILIEGKGQPRQEKNHEEIVGKVGDTLVLLMKENGLWHVVLRRPEEEIHDIKHYMTKYPALERAVAVVRKLLKEKGEI